MKQKLNNANNVTDAEGRLYHIFLKPGDLAERIILVGSAEIALVEILQITKNPVFIRIGTCAVISPEVALGDLVVSTAAVRLGNLEDYYVQPGYPSIANHQVIHQLELECQAKQADYKTGLTASAPGFYSPQGRSIEGLPHRNKKILAELNEMNVLNLEMESSVVFTLASLRHCKAGCLCVVVAHRASNDFINPDEANEKENVALIIGLNTLMNVTPKAI